MSPMNYNQTQEYYGEYKRGFFGGVEQIYIHFSPQAISGRGFAFDSMSGKYEIMEYEYEVSDVIDVIADKFNGKQCTALKVSKGAGMIYLPGLSVLTPTVKNSYNKYKELAAQLEAEKFKVEAFTAQKSSANLSMEDEIAEFKEKVNRLKIMRENGVLSPSEYHELKTKLMDLYN